MSTDRVGFAVEQWRAQFPGSSLAGLELSGRLRTLEHTMARLRGEVLAPHDLDAREWDVLSALWRGRGTPVSMSDLSAELLVVAGSVTHRVAGLERRGLVMRKGDPASRRRVLVTLTCEGAGLVEAVLPAILDSVSALEAVISPGVVEQLNGALSRAQFALDEMDDGGKVLPGRST